MDWHNFDSSWITLNVNTTSLVETSVIQNQYSGIQCSVYINTAAKLSFLA